MFGPPGTGDKTPAMLEQQRRLQAISNRPKRGGKSPMLAALGGSTGSSSQTMLGGY